MVKRVANLCEREGIPCLSGIPDLQVYTFCLLHKTKTDEGLAALLKSSNFLYEICDKDSAEKSEIAKALSKIYPRIIS